MKNRSSSFIIFLFLICAPYVIAQHKDCETALEVCGNSPIHILAGGGIGLADAGIENTCVGLEFSSMWVSWTVMESGMLTFVLAPDSLDQDIDFVVFKMGSDLNCNNKTQIRCMAAGAVVGQPPSQWVNCTGLTGLSTLETDIIEPPGCPSTSNNFLAPIQALAGDHYMMLINDFADVGSGYTLSFGGTAVLGCITGTSDQHDVNSKLLLTVNPTISIGTILINLNGDRLTDSYLNVVNMTGQIVHSQKQLMESEFEVDLHHLPPGAYFVAVKTNNTIQTQKFLIIK